MQNPSYLIRSRHAIYYFRYPVAKHSDGRLSISLNTRCPKEALRLAKILEYHAFMVMSKPEIQELDYIEVKEILRNHFAELLKKQKAKIDKDGALSLETVNQWLGLQEEVLETIRYVEDEVGGFMFDSDEDMPDEHRLDKKLKPIAENNNITDKDSKEYQALRKEYKHALNGYISALLTYNEGKGFYDHIPSQSLLAQNQNNRRDLKLGNVIDEYLKEIEGTIGERSYRDQRDTINYLLEVFDTDFLVTDIDHAQMRRVKTMLQNTPSNRNKKKETKGLPLARQIEAKDKHGLDAMSITTVNKYLGYMSALYNWALQNKYVTDNPFKGQKLKKEKGKKKCPFKKDQVSTILTALSKMSKTSALDKTRYWGTLIAIYTGARRNEVASLLPDDIKYDKGSDCWYFNITDEEESKKLKTEAAYRLVPVHPALLELGLLDYVSHAREVIAKNPKAGDHPTRLLYALTYTDEGWGRKLGRWFNETLLPELDLKTTKLTLHSLRHSFITYLNNAGVEGSTIKSLVGHEQGTVTFGKYADFSAEFLPVSSEAVNKLPY